MPLSHEYQFILDENVSMNLKKLLELRKYSVKTVQELGKRGIKNNKLLELVRKFKSILITCDKDFLHVLTASEDSIIVIDIHPLIDENVLPVFENFLKVFSPLDPKENIIILYENTFKLKKKINSY